MSTTKSNQVPIPTLIPLLTLKSSHDEIRRTLNLVLGAIIDLSVVTATSTNMMKTAQLARVLILAQVPLLRQLVSERYWIDRSKSDFSTLLLPTLSELTERDEQFIQAINTSAGILNEQMKG